MVLPPHGYCQRLILGSILTFLAHLPFREKPEEPLLPHMGEKLSLPIRTSILMPGEVSGEVSGIVKLREIWQTVPTHSFY